MHTADRRDQSPVCVRQSAGGRVRLPPLTSNSDKDSTFVLGAQPLLVDEWQIVGAHAERCRMKPPVRKRERTVSSGDLIHVDSGRWAPRSILIASV